MDGFQARTFSISGIEIHVYGLTEVITRNDQSVDVVFLMHGRTSNYKAVESMARKFLDMEAEHERGKQQRGLIVIAFDLRNHGHRLSSQQTNLTWVDGNENHA